MRLEREIGREEFVTDMDMAVKSPSPSVHHNFTNLHSPMKHSPVGKPHTPVGVPVIPVGKETGMSRPSSNEDEGTEVARQVRINLTIRSRQRVKDK